ncbi:uncharacterized protein A4U43_C01F6750 [Asparagus officinalis]|uniref:Uncharacterized protein n=1 Tax=Asparagus officinalis TaxID=4686 RepID=A0A5P1FME2_ASPOF|nr:uncharacterized protein A4U43_C01F6750 [Asparagus officinalis]
MVARLTPDQKRLRRLREAGRGELVEGLRLKVGRESDCRRRSVRGSSTSLENNWSRVVEGSSSRGFVEKRVESVIGVGDLFEGIQRHWEITGRGSLASARSWRGELVEGPRRRRARRDSSA